MSRPAPFVTCTHFKIMASSDYNENGVTGGDERYKPSYEASGAGPNGYDTEKAAVRTETASTNSDDPFGDETNSEVKYRTMRWW